MRLQFHTRLYLRRRESGCVPYFAALGISSPLCLADHDGAPGSMHGYDRSIRRGSIPNLAAKRNFGASLTNFAATRWG